MVTPMLSETNTSCPRTSNGAAKARVQPVRHELGAFALIEAAQHHHELVSADAPDRGTRDRMVARRRSAQAHHGVGGSDAAVEPRRRLDQQVVAGLMAHAVVDHLEPIQVDEHDHDLEGRRPPRMAEQAAQAILEQHAVGQSRQRVRDLAFRDVGIDPVSRTASSAPFADRDRARHHPAVGVSGALHAVLELEVRQPSLEMLGQRGAQRTEVVRMHAVEPGVERRPARRGRRIPAAPTSAARSGLRRGRYRQSKMPSLAARMTSA